MRNVSWIRNGQRPSLFEATANGANFREFRDGIAGEHEKAGLVAFFQTPDLSSRIECARRVPAPKGQKRSVIEQSQLLQIKNLGEGCVGMVAADSQMHVMPVEQTKVVPLERPHRGGIDRRSMVPVRVR